MKLDDLLTKDKLSREETERLRNLLRQLTAANNQPKQDVYTKKEVDKIVAGLEAEIVRTSIGKRKRLTAQLTTITASSPASADYAVQDLVNVGGYGFVTSDEAQSVMQVIINLQTRVQELETKLQALGLLE